MITMNLMVTSDYLMGLFTTERESERERERERGGLITS